MTDPIPDAAVEAMLLALAHHTSLGPEACRTGIAAALPHLLAERDAHVLDVTDEMTSAGMREWDLAMKDGERHWPVMLNRVFKAMTRAALVKPVAAAENEKVTTPSPP